MEDWMTKARGAVLLAAYSADPDAAPVYRIPKPRKWWQFWKSVEWETVRGVSRSQMERVQQAMNEHMAGRMRRAEAMFHPDPVPPWFNLNSPALDAPRDSGSHSKSEDPERG